MRHRGWGSLTITVFLVLTILVFIFFMNFAQSASGKGSIEVRAVEFGSGKQIDNFKVSYQIMGSKSKVTISSIKGVAILRNLKLDTVYSITFYSEGFEEVTVNKLTHSSSRQKIQISMPSLNRLGDTASLSNEEANEVSCLDWDEDSDYTEQPYTYSTTLALELNCPANSPCSSTSLSLADTCLDKTSLIEGICKEGKYSSILIKCPFGCSEGRCISTSPENSNDNINKDGEQCPDKKQAASKIKSSGGAWASNIEKTVLELEQTFSCGASGGPVY